MFKTIKQLILFRMGQKVSRGVAKKVGLGPISPLAGLIGGFRYMRKHS